MFFQAVIYDSFKSRTLAQFSECKQSLVTCATCFQIWSNMFRDSSSKQAGFCLHVCDSEHGLLTKYCDICGESVFVSTYVPLLTFCLVSSMNWLFGFEQWIKLKNKYRIYQGTDNDAHHYYLYLFVIFFQKCMVRLWELLPFLIENMIIVTVAHNLFTDNNIEHFISLLF